MGEHMRRQIASHPYFVFCENVVEDINHKLCQCFVAQSIWGAWLKKEAKDGDLLFGFVCWNLWLRKNKMIFEPNYVEVERVNIDAATTTIGELASVERIIWDSNSQWVMEFIRRCGACIIGDAKLWGSYDALSCAWDMGSRKVILETNNLDVHLLEKRIRNCAADGMVSLVLGRPYGVCIMQKAPLTIIQLLQDDENGMGLRRMTLT
ncbi:hypothetical protein Godav_027904 [Gossypium davidsonii]|uniref:Uncharacterized protein n=2 Tax=Gossypium TaxID=3633 RepID=A0A7J8RXL8_GOSDV|nr:hypothetical protein [Gossypium davidsonii]MBA0653950.1 hypothetical protein [Gossypium klotzschianum]